MKVERCTTFLSTHNFKMCSLQFIALYCVFIADTYLLLENEDIAYADPVKCVLKTI